MTARCGGCGHFEGHSRRLEAAITGWATLSSADASVRGDDGLCRHHDLIVAQAGRCDDRVPRQLAATAPTPGGGAARPGKAVPPG
jgi:hypothetical protein